MALVLADRVKETTTTTGTGTVTLLGASTGYQSFAAVGNANTTYYCIAGQTGSEWEVGIGTYTAVGTTLARNTVLASSNAGSLVNFSAGTKDVFVTQPAKRAVYDSTGSTGGTDAVSTNTANTVVRRDASGNFSAGTVTATLAGNASTATTLQTARTINAVSFNGSADIAVGTVYDTNYRRVTNPGGGEYVTTAGTVTGAITINLPVAPSNTMIRVTVRVYEYVTNRSFDICCGGYAYNVGNTWANNPFAYIVGNPGIDRNFTVRFGYNATSGKAVIYIGELASTWAYPQVYITEAQFGYSGYTLSYTTGWAITFEATAFQNVTATITNPQVGYATSTNTANADVKRDASGNFSAGTITATLSGNASTATTATNLAGGSAGTIPYQSAAGTTVQLAAGTAGQILQSNGAAAPSWVTNSGASKAYVNAQRILFGF